jgi:LL-diaminopimelate aminotransferase
VLLSHHVTLHTRHTHTDILLPSSPPTHPLIYPTALPKSIFEIDGALECAIEVNSFSKYAGFTGVRLGWTVVPKALKYADGTPVHQDFNRIMTTAFNGASNIVQQGGLAILDDAGLKEIDTLIDYYLANAAKLRQTMEGLGYKVRACVRCGRVVAWLRGWLVCESHSVLLPDARSYIT